MNNKIIQQLRNDGLETIADEIERLLKIESDMEIIKGMYNRNSLSSYSDDVDELAKIMTPNKKLTGLPSSPS